MNIHVIESGWLAKNDNLPWAINGISIDPITKTRREEYHWAATRCTGDIILDAATGYVAGWHVLPEILLSVVPGRTVVAVDNNPQTLTLPKPQGIIRSMANIAVLPFADATFDTVCCISTLEHFPMMALPQAFFELVRVTKHRLLITADYGSWLPLLYRNDGMLDLQPIDSELRPPVYAAALEIKR